MKKLDKGGRAESSVKVPAGELPKPLGRPPFYADGLRFECQGSGKCCTSRGAYGYVYLTPNDQKRFAKFFKLTVPAFLKQYTGKTNGWVHLLDPREMGITGVPEGDCIFLDGNRCKAYEGRPEHCRTWPFWPENMNPRAWTSDIAVNCPGVGKGKLYSREEIDAILAPQQADKDNGDAP
jgi:Fe-S-cluster containining protein